MRADLRQCFWTIFWGCCLLCASIPGAQAEVSVHAALTPISFDIDEAAQLTITVQDGKSADVELPEIKGLVIEKRGQSSQFSMINGAMSSSVTLTYLVQADKAGQYAIPSLKVKTGGTSVQTLAIPFTVTEHQQRSQQKTPSATPPGNQNAEPSGESAFLQFSPVKDTLYVGEILPITIKAYFRQGIRASLTSLPALTGDGCVLAQQLGDKPQQNTETVHGTSYTVLTWTTSLSAIKEGTHQLKIGLDATLMIPQRSLSTSMFGQNPFDDDFFANAFGSFRQKPVHVSSQDTPIRILPLPETGRPKDFTGAVGTFQLQTSASSAQAEVGEPLNMTITVSGTGNFDRIEAPHLSESDQWKTYAATSKNATPDKSQPATSRIFEQALIAKTADVKEIPSIHLPYFDPQRGIYQIAKSQPIPVKITGPAGPAQQPATPAAQPVAQQASARTKQPEPPAKNQAQSAPDTPATKSGHDGNNPLLLEQGSTGKALVPTYKKMWFIVTLALLLLWLATVCLLLVKKHRQRRNPSLQEHSRRRKEIQEGLQDLALAEAEGNSALFLEKCRRLIQQQLARQWQVEPSAITHVDLERRLPADSPLLEIFSLAEQAAYAGTRLSAEQMNTYFNALREGLNSLI